MFLGHFAVGFAGKRAAPRASLGTLFLGAQLVDLVWPTLLLAGVERVRIAPGATRVTPLEFVSYPVTHSLVAVIAWATAAGAAYFLLRRYRAGAVVLGALVLSHWLLDAVVHRPDLPILPGGPRFGLGLWNSLPLTLVVELGLFVAGVTLYVRTTRPRRGIGSAALASLVLVLLLIYAGNLFGPLPESTGQIAALGHAQWLLVAWAWWVDREREVEALEPHVT